MPAQDFQISVVIPAKDEAQRLPKFLDKLFAYIGQSQYRYEILVVDDGSTDSTVASLAPYQRQYSYLRVFSLNKNWGKGTAVKQGLLKASGAVVLFMDADGSTPPEAIEENLHYFDKGYDVVIGSRVKKDAAHTVQTKVYRVWMGRIFNLFVQCFLFDDIQDSQCGFKMFRRDIVKDIFERVSCHGFGFDLHLLYAAKRLGLEIKETPVNWSHVDDSKIHLLKDSLMMLRDMIEIRFKRKKAPIEWNPQWIQEHHVVKTAKSCL